MTRLLTVNLLLYAAMSLSKAAWPLYLEANQALPLLAATYTAMAITGMVSSALAGRLIDVVGISRMLTFGSLVYGFALLMRLQLLNIQLAIVTGILMGLGASVVVTCLRPWMMQESTPSTRPRLVSRRILVLNLGTACGAALLSLIILLSPTLSASYSLGLVIPSLLVFLIPLFRPSSRVSPVSLPTNRRDSRTALTSISSPAIAIFGVSALSGFGVSMILPYLPLILQRTGGLPVVIGATISIIVLVKAFVPTFLPHSLGIRHPLKLVAGAQLGVAVASLLAAQAGQNFAVVTWTMLLVFAFLGVSTYGEELYQSGTFPYEFRGTLFGAVGSGFLAGDAVGGILGAVAIQNGGVVALLHICSISAVAVAATYPLLAWLLRRKLVARRLAI